MFLQISTNNICQLKCNWCTTERGVPEVMSLSTFEYVVDDFADTFGEISMVDMTPIVGELSLTPDWLKMLEYLYEKDEVVKFDFVTNFLNFDKVTINKLLKFRDKLSIVISIYGHDRQSFMRSTNVDCWSDFVESMTNLQECLSKNEYECFPISFYFRYDSFENVPKDSYLYKLVRYIQFTSKNVVVMDSTMSGVNHNWAEQVTNVPDIIDCNFGTGVCLHSILQNCVLPNGDITMCGMNDIHGKMIIGNLFESTLGEIYGPNSLYDMYRKEPHPMCSRCTEHESPDNEKKDVEIHENKLNKIRKL